MRQVLGAAEQRSQGRASTSLRITPRRSRTRRGVSFSIGRRCLAQGRPEHKRLAGRAAGRLSSLVQAAAEARSTRHQFHPAAAAAVGRTEKRQALSLQGEVTCFSLPLFSPCFSDLLGTDLRRSVARLINRKL